MIPTIDTPRKTNPEVQRSECHRLQLERYHNENYQTFLSTAKDSAQCPHCSESDVICHGYFDKRFQIVSDPELLPEHSFIILSIQRFMCKNCRRTFSIMPKNCAAFLSLSLDELTKILKHGFDALHVLSLHVLSRLKRLYTQWCASKEHDDSVWSFMMDSEQHRLERHRHKRMSQSP